MRNCGILLHITSLPSPYGIGTFGKAAEEFADWLKAAGQSVWQVLPLGPTGFGDSPYQAFSTFAGNPLLIDLDDLVENGLLTKAECEAADYGANPNFVDFEKVYRTKMKLLRQAHKSFQEDVAYLAFIKEEEDWLDGYALFMAIKGKNDQASWLKWDKEIRLRKPETLDRLREELREEINFWRFVQYIFYTEWLKLRRYCNKNGIKIMGDIPIYVSPDSADVWENPELFLLDSDCRPRSVAGVPPDYFSKTGQLWGNPLYDWEAHKKEGFLWWTRRLEKSQALYDMVRIDHFRAFDSFYSIPAEHQTAENGRWENGPGIEFFNAITQKLPNLEIIAEDLGDITDGVRRLLRQTGYPGMRVFQFGFFNDCGDNEHMPHSYPRNCVAYTGTHDNQTFMGWYKEQGLKTKALIKRYTNNSSIFEKPSKAAVKALYASHASLVVIPMQDILGLGAEARMNTPSTLGGNWVWRLRPKMYTAKQGKWLLRLAETYFRVE